MTREDILARFSGGRLPGRRGSSAAGFARVPAAGLRGDHSLTPGARPSERVLTPAAVLVPLVEHPNGMTVLLTQRTQHLTDHAGQISFPGGRIEPIDPDPVAAALRETEEEIGLERTLVEVVGRLDTYVTGTGFEITPVVGLVHAPCATRADPFEVAEIFEVPLDFVVDPRNHQRGSREWHGVSRSFFVLPFENRYIWGATAGMLVNLAEILAREPPPARPHTDF